MLKRAFSGGRGISSPFQCIVVFYSTSSLSPVAEDFGCPGMVEYLVNSLGFSQESATSLSRKIRPLKSSRKPQKVVDFFKSSGFDDTQIMKLVKFHPRVLFSDVDKTLKPKIKAFEEFGLSSSETRMVITANPGIFKRRVKTQIMPILEFVKSFATSHENFVKVFSSTKWSFSAWPLDSLRANVSFLRDCGASMERIEMLLLKKNTFLFRNHRWLLSTVERAEANLGLDRRSPMLLHLLVNLSSFSDETIESKLKVFRGFGWTETDLSQMIRKSPYSLGLSANSIRVRLEYLVGEMGYEPAYLASHPILLMYSMEKRVKPRHYVLTVLKERKLLKTDTNLYTLLLPNKSVFVKRYVLPFKDKVPHLYNDYVAMIGSAPKL